jgi:hypothetical protein
VTLKRLKIKNNHLKPRRTLPMVHVWLQNKNRNYYGCHRFGDSSGPTEEPAEPAE